MGNKNYEEAKNILIEAMDMHDDAIEVFENCKTAEQILEVGFELLSKELKLNLKGHNGFYIKNVIREMCLECLNKPYSKYDNQGDIDDRCDSINDNFKEMSNE